MGSLGDIFTSGDTGRDSGSATMAEAHNAIDIGANSNSASIRQDADGAAFHDSIDTSHGLEDETADEALIGS